MPSILTERLSPIVKWPGGKSGELSHIHAMMPLDTDNYYEPFVGGGALYFSIDSNKKYINDKSHELIGLYNAIKNNDDVFIGAVNEMVRHWNSIAEIINRHHHEIIIKYIYYATDEYTLEKVTSCMLNDIIMKDEQFSAIIADRFDVDVPFFMVELNRVVSSKLTRMKKLEKEKGQMPNKDILANIEGAIKASFYMYIRRIYNRPAEYKLSDGLLTAVFFFIRNYTYGGMFRYNSSGGFNVPYGGIGYNSKSLDTKIEYFHDPKLLAHLNSTSITDLDFKEFFDIHIPGDNDFIFLDPPYDSEFSTYAKNVFGKKEHIDLAEYLITECKFKWLMIIKNTEFIYDLYNKDELFISAFDKKYLVSFRNRNDKNSIHLIITNYSVTRY